MASIKLLAALVIVIERIPRQVQGLILVILIVVTIYQVSRPQVKLDTDYELLPAPSEVPQSLEPAATTPAFTRPPLHRHNCFVLGPNGLTSEPLSSDWEFDSTSASDSEGYETAPEDAAPARTMAEKRALEYFEDRLRQHRESVSSETSATPAVQTPLTVAQLREDPSDAEDADMIKRRNIKMREEGVRVNVGYSQLANLRPTPIQRSAPATLSNAAATAGNLRGGASRTTSPPSFTSSPPSSRLSATPTLSGLRSPAPTPCDGPSGTTPDHTPGSASVLPTSGQAGETLSRIDEKLLAIPADAVSRRLLRDGRAILHQRKRLPRSVSSAEASPALVTPLPDESVLQTSEWYPSEMMKE